MPAKSTSHKASSSHFTRRDTIKLAFSVGIPTAGIAACSSDVQFIPEELQRSNDVSPEAALNPLSNYSPRARQLVSSSHVIDMLCNVRHRIMVRGEINNLEEAQRRFLKWYRDPSSIEASELQRYWDSDIDVFHSGVAIGQLLPGEDAYARANFLFTSWPAIFDAHPDIFLPINGPASLAESRTSDRIAVLPGIQNGDHFRTEDDVAHFYALGQRISQLTYNHENHLGGGAFSDVGLKPAGRKIVHAMNAVGMVVDLSHSNAATSRDVIEISKVTPIISHTNCQALNRGFDRAMPDDVVMGVAERGGVVGLTVLRQFVTRQEPTTIDHFIAHIDHIASLAGIEHVGIGSDSDLLPFDGVDDEARDRYLSGAGQEAYQWRKRLDIDGLDHPRRMYDIADALIRRGYSDHETRLVLGGNFARVLNEIWTTRI